MSSNRLNNRVAWDHSVLVNPASRLDWRQPARITQSRPAGSPVPSVVVAWCLIAWTGVSAWRLWTATDLDSHISMRFLMRGDFEEIAGVVAGLLWACIPAWAAFFVARRAREVSMDDVGSRAYWTSLLVSIIACLGVLRPTWDDNAGSRIVRVSPAAPSTTTSAAAPDAAGPAASAAGGPIDDGSALLDIQAPSEFGSLRVAEARAAGVPTPRTGSVAGHWGRSRAAAMRAMLAREQPAQDSGTVVEASPADGPN